MRLGIFGGTFNPPHLGHLLIAERVVEELQLDKLLFVPAANPPHKLGAAAIAAGQHRVEMLLRSIAGHDRFDISTIEIDRAGVSFTIETLRELCKSYPAAEMFLLIGSDNLAEFHTWRDPEGICALSQLVVLQREGFAVSGVDPRWRKHLVPVRTPVIEISGTEIRQRVRDEKRVDFYLPASVAEYIAAENLYKI